MYEAGSDFGFECVNSLSYEQCSLDVSGTESVRDQMKPITILFNAKYKPLFMLWLFVSIHDYF